MGKIIGVAIAVAVLFGGAYFWNQSNVKKMAGTEQEQMNGPEIEVPVETIYYYGEECPHCKDVMKFLEENKIAEKVKFEKKEVWHDKKNAALMNDTATKVCGLDVKKIGVPFLFAEGKCYIGTPEVTGFFKKAAGI